MDGKLSETHNSQGIPIGNEAEGFIANIFLKEADEALFNLDINFGRYVDDFRIFTNSKSDAVKASIILQEFLLKIGVNLNALKTKVIEAEEEIINFIEESKESGVSAMPFEEEEYNESKQEKKLDKTDIIKEIDLEKVNMHKESYYLEHQTGFLKIEDIDNEEKAKQFGKFLNKIPLGIELETQIFSEHIEWLHQLSKMYPKHGKLYSWLFVKFLSQDYSDDVQRISLKYLFTIFDDELVNAMMLQDTVKGY